MAPIKIKLKKSELDGIKRITKKGLEDVRVIKRALILKSRHLGMGTEDIIDLLDTSCKTVSRTLGNYHEYGFEATIYDAPRTGRPVEFDARSASNIIAMVCSNPPDGYAKWTIDLIAEETVKRGIVDSISKSKIQIILQEHDLKPWREKMWCVADLTDEYIEKMEDVLDVYERPYNPSQPVICIDEKPVALIGDKHERSQSKPGSIGKKDYEYTRNGSVNVFCAVEPLQGVYINKVTENRKGPEFAKFLSSIARKYEDAEKIILVMDNLSTHTLKSLTDFYGKEKGNDIWNRFEVHNTPKHGSWLNQAEIAIGMYSRQCLGDGRVGSFERLKKMTSHWSKRANRKSIQIKWTFNTVKARDKFNYEIK